MNPNAMWERIEPSLKKIFLAVMDSAAVEPQQQKQSIPDDYWEQDRECDIHDLMEGLERSGLKIVEIENRLSSTKARSKSNYCPISQALGEPKKVYDKVVFYTTFSRDKSKEDFSLPCLSEYFDLMQDVAKFLHRN